ncbi:hypothetical protein ACTFIV_006210 [Dictyostelium citrinum]
MNNEINKEYIVKNRDQLLPEPIGEFKSSIICIFISLFFVLSIYFRNKSTNRNDPDVIKKRITRVFFSTFVSLALLYFFIPDSDNKLYVFLKIIGIPTNVWDLINSIIPLLLTMILFLGPMVMDTDFLNISYDIETLRDIIVGPLVEELVFRSVICPILFFGGFSQRYIIILSPFLFGFAHAHHIFQKGNYFINLIKVLFQVCFTSLFGMYSAFIFFRTGNILACFIVHSFCNIMGLPDFGGISDHDNNKVVGSCFIIGLIGFIFGVLPITNPEYYCSIYNLLEAW